MGTGGSKVDSVPEIGTVTSLTTGDKQEIQIKMLEDGKKLEDYKFEDKTEVIKIIEQIASKLKIKSDYVFSLGNSYEVDIDIKCKKPEDTETDKAKNLYNKYKDDVVYVIRVVYTLQKDDVDDIVLRMSLYFEAKKDNADGKKNKTVAVDFNIINCEVQTDEEKKKEPLYVAWIENKKIVGDKAENVLGEMFPYKNDKDVIITKTEQKRETFTTYKYEDSIYKFEDDINSEYTIQFLNKDIECSTVIKAKGLQNDLIVTDAGKYVKNYNAELKDWVKEVKKIQRSEEIEEKSGDTKLTAYIKEHPGLIYILQNLDKYKIKDKEIKNLMVEDIAVPKKYVSIYFTKYILPKVKKVNFKGTTEHTFEYDVTLKEYTENEKINSVLQPMRRINAIIQYDEEKGELNRTINMYENEDDEEAVDSIKDTIKSTNDENGKITFSGKEWIPSIIYADTIKGGEKEKEGLSTGAKIGIGCGVGALIIIIIAIIIGVKNNKK